MTQLRSRAAFDLACSSASLKVTDLADRTYGVEGCGKRATYVWVYSNQSWVIDQRSSQGSDSESAASALSEASSPSSAGASSASSPKPAAPRPDLRSCDQARDYRRRAAEAGGAVQQQLVRMAEKKEAECAASKEP